MDGSGKKVFGISVKNSSIRFGFCKEGCSIYVVQKFINSLKHFLLQEDYFPLTLTLSPIGGEGKKVGLM